MIRISLLRFLCLLCTLLLVCSVHVLADEEYTFGGKGLIDYVKDYFGTSDDLFLEPDVSVIVEDDLVSEEQISLLSLSPEDIENGVLNFTFNSVNTYLNKTFASVSVSSSSALNSVRTGTMNNRDLPDAAVMYQDTLSISSSSTIIESGKIFDMSLTNIELWWDNTRTTDDGTTTYARYNTDPSLIEVTMYYVYGDGTRTAFEPSEYILSKSDNKRFYFSCSVTEPVPRDIYGIDIVFGYDVVEAFGVPREAALGIDTDVVTRFAHITLGFYNSQFTFHEVEQTNGLLGSIISWLQGIWDAIVSLGSSIVSGISDLLIWLFVPSTEFFEEYFDQFDYLLEERMGFMYTAYSYIIDLYYNLIDYWKDEGSVQSYIVFPVVEIPISEDTVFSFGGWEVNVIPEGFESIVETLKMIVNLICTIYMIITSWHFFERFIDGGAGSAR